MYSHQQKTWSISKIFIALALIAAAVFGYIAYFGNLSLAQVEPDPMMPPVTPGMPTPVAGLPEGQKEIIGKDLLALLDKIEALNIDTSIFTDRAYLTLQDFSVAIIPEVPGRSNPFAPISGRASTSATPRR
jgi:hypothetical protein